MIIISETINKGHEIVMRQVSYRHYKADIWETLPISFDWACAPNILKEVKLHLNPGGDVRETASSGIEREPGVCKDDFLVLGQAEAFPVSIHHPGAALNPK